MSRTPMPTSQNGGAPQRIAETDGTVSVLWERLTRALKGPGVTLSYKTSSITLHVDVIHRCSNLPPYVGNIETILGHFASVESVQLVLQRLYTESFPLYALASDEIASACLVVAWRLGFRDARDECLKVMTDRGLRAWGHVCRFIDGGYEDASIQQRDLIRRISKTLISSQPGYLASRIARSMEDNVGADDMAAVEAVLQDNAAAGHADVNEQALSSVLREIAFFHRVDKKWEILPDMPPSSSDKARAEAAANGATPGAPGHGGHPYFAEFGLKVAEGFPWLWSRAKRALGGANQKSLQVLSEVFTKGLCQVGGYGDGGGRAGLKPLAYYDVVVENGEMLEEAFLDSLQIAAVRDMEHGDADAVLALFGVTKARLLNARHLRHEHGQPWVVREWFSFQRHDVQLEALLGMLRRETRESVCRMLVTGIVDLEQLGRKMQAAVLRTFGEMGQTQFLRSLKRELLK
eukprot:jgi/Mesvir1/2142/Mv16663-RA.1